MIETDGIQRSYYFSRSSTLISRNLFQRALDLRNIESGISDLDESGVEDAGDFGELVGVAGDEEDGMHRS